MKLSVTLGILDDIMWHRSRDCCCVIYFFSKYEALWHFSLTKFSNGITPGSVQVFSRAAVNNL